MLFLVNIYSAKLSHMLSDKHRQKLKIFGSNSRFADDLIFCSTRILERDFEMYHVLQVAFIALPCKSSVKTCDMYLSAKQPDSLKTTRSGVFFYKVLNRHFKPIKEAKRNGYYPLIHLFIYLKSVTAMVFLASHVMLY